MKKLIKVFLSFLMSMSLCGVGMVSASAATYTNPSSVTPTVALDSYINTTTLDTYTLTYTSSNTVTVAGTKYCGRKVPLEIKYKGPVTFTTINPTVSQKKSTSGNYTYSGYADFEVYTDANCTSRLDYIDTFLSAGDTVTRTIDFTAAGTYYLVFKTDYAYNSYRPTGTDKMNFTVHQYSAANRTLTNGKAIAIAPQDSVYGYRYYKIVMPCKGNVILQGSKHNLSYEVCNSKLVTVYDNGYLNSSCNYRNNFYLGEGTWWIKTKGSYSPDSSAGSLLKATLSTFANPLYSTATKLVSEITPVNSKSAVFYRFTPAKTCGLQIAAVGGSTYLTLYDANFKALSGKDYIYGGSTSSNYVYYAVTGGKTYYVKATGGSSKIKLGFTNVALSNYGGASLSKSTSMTKKTTYQGSLLAGSNAADWYKLKISSKANFQVNVATRSNGSNSKIQVVLYDSKGSQVIGGSLSLYGSKNSGKIYTSSAFPAGTYYVKVMKGNTTTSGYYTINWGNKTV